jgi:HAD superfamily hydrolase (TIGR01509 family)
VSCAYVVFMAHAQHAVLFDLDGTLVDSVYQHARIWHELLAEHGQHVPHWKVHRAIGLPSDRLLAWLLGARPEAEADMVAAHERRFLEQAANVALRATHGAVALLADLDARAVPYYAVTSASESIQGALFAALGRSIPIAEGAKGSKPHAEPILGAVHILGLDPLQVTMIGDAVWDGEAARRAGTHFIALRSGGNSDESLRQAGALWVEDSPRELIGRL